MTQGPVFGHIRRLLIPMSFAIVAMMLVGLVDAYWVGRLGTAEQAAVQMAFPVMMLVMSVSIGLGAGAVSVVSRAAGAKDPGLIKRLATDAFTLTLLIIVCVSFIGFLATEQIFTLMGASEAVLPHVTDYMQIYFAGMVFMVGPMVANNLLRALGEAVLPSVMMMGSAAINLVLDPIFILDELWGVSLIGLGVSGAATATVIANLITAIIVYAYIILKEDLIDLSWPGLGAVLSNWGEIARVGVPATFSNFFNPFALTIAIASVARFSDAAVAGYGVGARLEAFALVPLFALSASIGPITGQNGGAGLTSRVREAFVGSFLFAAGWSLTMAVVLFIAAPFLAPLFLPSAEGQQMAVDYWRIAPWTVAGYGVAMAAAAGFNGLGRPQYGVIFTAGRALVLMAPLAWIGGSIGGPLGVVWGLAAANLIAGAAIAAYVLLFAPMKAHEKKRKAGPAAPEAEAPAE